MKLLAALLLLSTTAQALTIHEGEPVKTVRIGECRVAHPSTLKCSALEFGKDVFTEFELELFYVTPEVYYFMVNSRDIIIEEERGGWSFEYVNDCIPTSNHGVSCISVPVIDNIGNKVNTTTYDIDFYVTDENNLYGVDR